MFSSFTMLKSAFLGELWNESSRLRRSEHGNVAILFALSLFPMIGIVGLGVDISRTMAVKTALQGASDAAALAAANRAMATLQATNNNVSAAQTAGNSAAQQVFLANATKVGRLIGGAPTPTISVNPGAANITATVSFQANVPTAFGKIFGTKLFAVSGNSAASLSMPKYLNINVVVDISQSMGLASTTSGQSQLQSLTGGCQFGCHVYQSGQTGTLPYEQQAHAANIQLRIDVIRSATQNMIQTAQQSAGATPLISFALFTLQGGNGTTDKYGMKSDGKPFNTLMAQSTNYTALYNSAGQIDLGDNNSSGIGDTDYGNGMPQLSSAVPASGNGTAGSPQQFVFLMTDGVADTWASALSNCPANTVGWNGSHCTQAFDSSTCATLKNNNVTVAVLYTTYLPMNGTSSYDTLVAPFASKLVPNLTACASPGWFYQATDANDIQSAINALFARATGSGVLTQ